MTSEKKKKANRRNDMKSRFVQSRNVNTMDLPSIERSIIAHYGPISAKHMPLVHHAAIFAHHIIVNVRTNTILAEEIMTNSDADALTICRYLVHNYDGSMASLRKCKNGITRKFHWAISELREAVERQGSE